MLCQNNGKCKLKGLILSVVCLNQRFESYRGLHTRAIPGIYVVEGDLGLLLPAHLTLLHLDLRLLGLPQVEALHGVLEDLALHPDPLQEPLAVPVEGLVALLTALLGEDGAGLGQGADGGGHVLQLEGPLLSGGEQDGGTSEVRGSFHHLIMLPEKW